IGVPAPQLYGKTFPPPGAVQSTFVPDVFTVPVRIDTSRMVGGACPLTSQAAITGTGFALLSPATTSVAGGLYDAALGSVIVSQGEFAVWHPSKLMATSMSCCGVVLVLSTLPVS